MGNRIPLRKRDTGRLIRTALGEEAADLAVLGARLLNVYTGELIDDTAVAVAGDRIAYVGELHDRIVGAGTRVVDAAGKTLIPGLIEGHTHMVFATGVHEFVKAAAPGGTTTVITETMEAYPVAGIEGVTDFLAALSDQPIKFFGTAPAMVSTSAAAYGIDPADLKALLSREDILGLGESYWQGILQKPEALLPAFDETRRRGKSIEGHSAGARGKKLNAYVAAGAGSCHEPISADEVLARLRLGLHVMAREGSVRRELEEIVKILKKEVDLRRFILSTDSVDPVDLNTHGFMDFVVRKAVTLGFDPVTAVQAATLNVAEHYGLDDDIGAVAPGRIADMVILSDLESFIPETVISNGRIIARNGEMHIPPRKHTYRTESINSIRLPAPLRPDIFTVGVPAAGVEVRIIHLIAPLVTREEIQHIKTDDGRVAADPAADLLKIAAIDRTRTPGKTFTGLLRGFGMRTGALASSASWDTSDIIVVGADDADMALAVNRIREMRGGIAFAENGKIPCDIPMPVFGLISELPLPELADRILAVRQAVIDRGFPYSDPLLTIATLTGAAIPHLRICEEGLVNIRTGQTLGLYA